MYPITENTSLEATQQQPKLKYIAHVNRRENNDIIIMLTLHTKNLKADKGNPINIEKVITATAPEDVISLKNIFSE